MADKGHTSREFERELRTLRERLLAMGGRAEQQIVRSVESITRRDDTLAKRVIADDVIIDQDEVEIDELAFFILARRQPVASDLRFIMLALKIVTDLERIGDLAVNIAKRGKDLSRFELSAVFPKITLLAERVREALKSALDAFVAGDTALAEQVIESDRDIDNLNLHVIADVIEMGAQRADDVVRSLALSSLSRYLERMGDHATNIAEMVIYAVRGSDVRHHLPRGNSNI
jgi:phosphate transport system protein